MSDAADSDKQAKIRLAESLEQQGDMKAAADAWWNVCAMDPYDRDSRVRFAELMYDINVPVIAAGGVVRSRVLLRMIGLAFPTARMSSAYFDNLRKLFHSAPKREQRGIVVLGIGSGRCGSTTLAYALGRVSNVCATHENPPMLYWEPLEEQLSFHVERFRILTQYFAVVFDAAYWWLNSLERIFAEFRDTKVIGLCRETQSCVESYMAHKGSGKGSLNHWAIPGNGIWATSPGDPSLPSYEAPPSLVADPDAAKRAMITRYVTEYNARVARLAEAYPDRVLVVRMEDLNDAGTYARISAFLGCEVGMPDVVLNVGRTPDSNRADFIL
jgi:Sulfotransferase domain